MSRNRVISRIFGIAMVLIVVASALAGLAEPVAAATAPTVETRPASLIVNTVAMLNGRIVSDGGSSIIERRFSWGTTPTCSGGSTSTVGVSGDYFSYYLMSLNPGTIYYFQAWAQNSAGLWGKGAAVSFTTLLPAPTLNSPANGLTGVSTTPTFSWSPVTGANHYWLMVATSPSALPTDPYETSCPSCTISLLLSSTSYTPPTDLRPDTTYYWQVQAYNDSTSPITQGAYSQQRSFTTFIFPAPALSAPANSLTGVSTTPSFTWSPVSGATSYRILVSADPSALTTDPMVSTCSSCIINATPTTNSYTPSSGVLSEGTTYYWQVHGRSSTQFGTWSAKWSFTTGCTAPSTPSNPSPSNTATGVNIDSDLDWSDSSYATSYDVYFGTSSNPPSYGSTSSSNYPLPTLSYNTRYYWRIVARNTCGTISGPTWEFTTEAQVISPTISYSPSSFSFSTTQGSSPSSQTLSIWNSGGGILSWSVSDDATWLNPSPTSGSSTGGTNYVDVSVASSTMGQGTYSATITISASGATNTPRTVPVSLSIIPPAPRPTLSLDPTSGMTGSLVNVSGSGWTPGTVMLTFGGLPWTSVTAGSDGQITVASGSNKQVSVHAPPGVKVVTGIDSNYPAVLSATTAFRVVARPLSLTPNSGPRGTEVMVTGSYMTPNGQIDPGNLIFGGLAWSTAAIPINSSGVMQPTMLVVPDTAPVGMNSVLTIDSGELVAYGTFTVNPVGTYSATLIPNNGPVGKSVTIQAVNYPVNVILTAKFDGVAMVTSPMTVTVPEDGNVHFAVMIPAAPAGQHEITVYMDGMNPVTNSFTVQPKVTITPSAGPVGTSVTIHGTGFFYGGVSIDVHIEDQTEGNLTLCMAGPTDDTGSFVTTCTIPSLSSGPKTVWGFDGAGFSSWTATYANNDTFTVTSSIPTPTSTPPTAISPGTGSGPGPIIPNLTPTLQWSDVSGADYYALAISRYPYGTENIIYNPQQVYGTSHAVPSDKLEYGQKYCWNMQAHNSCGWSDISNTLYFQTLGIISGVQGIDVSHWQGDIDWNQVNQGGYEFAFVKATEGDGWTDPKFETNMNSGRDTGMLMGAYHFARPDLGNDAATEARYFVNVAREHLREGNLRPVLDLEVGAGLGKEALSYWVHEWISTVRDETGVEPILYVNSNYANNYLDTSVARYDLWIAHWTYDTGATPNTGIWDNWTFWQYSNQGSVPGITGNVDLDLFNGEKTELQNYVIGATQLVITSPLQITPVKDAYVVGEALTAEFTITNRGSASVAFDELVVGGRDPDGGVIDFQKTLNVTLNAGAQYRYAGTLVLPNMPGTYHFFCAYHTVAHLPGEDGNNWNTNIDVEINGQKVEDFSEARRCRERDITVFESIIAPAPPPQEWQEITGPWNQEVNGERSKLSQVAVQPDNPEVIYAAVKYEDYWGDSGDDLYKSADGGQTWQPVNQGLPGLNLVPHHHAIGAIAIAPSNPNIVYIGTTDFSPHSSLLPSAKGIYKSTNGGLAWTPVGGPRTGWWIFKSYNPISSLVVNPTNPDIVYVGTIGAGIWKTTNGGTSWEKIWDAAVNTEALLEVNVLVISPVAPNTIYAAAFNYVPLEANGWSQLLIHNRLIKSGNGGATWTTLRELPPVASKIDDIDVSAENANTVYYITDVFDVCKSVDGGMNWEDARGTGGPNPLPGLTPLNHGTGKVGSICVHPDLPNVILVGKQFEHWGIYLSPDSGAEWSSLGLDTHIKDLTFSSSVNHCVLYATAFDGLWKLAAPTPTPTPTPTPNTPAGSNVTVPLPGTVVTFGNVTGEGTTSVNWSADNPGGPTPPNFYVHGLFMNISTTATYTDTVNVCMGYDESGVANENNLRLFHWNGAIWEDVTTLPVDTVNNIICGNVNTLSPFFVGEPAAQVQTATGTGTARFSVSSGAIENLTAVAEGSLPTEGKPSLVFPHGFFRFDITGLSNGETVTVVMELPSNIRTNSQYWKWDSTLGWHQINFSDNDGDRIIAIQLTDNGTGDSDPTPGRIHDDGGPGNPSGGGGGASGGGGCFIATAAYGSSLDSHVDTLRSFRDQYLETNPIGSAFVSLYYKVSPPMAEFINEHPALKPIVRAGLVPAVVMSTVAVNTTSAEKMAILGSLALVCIALAIWVREKARRLGRGR